MAPTLSAWLAEEEGNLADMIDQKTHIMQDDIETCGEFMLAYERFIVNLGRVEVLSTLATNTEAEIAKEYSILIRAQDHDDMVPQRRGAHWPGGRTYDLRT